MAFRRGMVARNLGENECRNLVLLRGFLGGCCYAALMR